MDIFRNFEDGGMFLLLISSIIFTFKTELKFWENRCLLVLHSAAKSLLTMFRQTTITSSLLATLKLATSKWLARNKGRKAMNHRSTTGQERDKNGIERGNKDKNIHSSSSNSNK